MPESAVLAAPDQPFQVLHQAICDVVADADFDTFLWDVCSGVLDGSEAPVLEVGTYFRLALLGYYENLSSDDAIVARALDSRSASALLGPYPDDVRLDAARLAETRRCIGLRHHLALASWLNDSHANRHESSPGTRFTVGVLPLESWRDYLTSLDTALVASPRPRRQRRGTVFGPALVRHIFEHLGNITTSVGVVAAGVWLEQKAQTPILKWSSWIIIIVGGFLLVVAGVDTSTRTRHLDARGSQKVFIILMFVALFVAITTTFILYRD